MSSGPDIYGKTRFGFTICALPILGCLGGTEPDHGQLAAVQTPWVGDHWRHLVIKKHVAEDHP